MINFKIKWVAVTISLALAACGGGGGGDGAAIDPVTGGPAGGGPAGGAQRSGKMAYFFNNKIYSVDMATGLSRQLADTLSTSYVAHSLTPTGGLATTFHDVLSPNSTLYIYKPDGSFDKGLGYKFGIVSEPSFSPDGQTIAMTAYTRSDVFNSPRVYQTVFSDRNGVVQEDAIGVVTDIGWLPDGRAIYKSALGLIIFKLPFNAESNASAVLVPNTKDASTFSVSPDGSKIAFIAKTSSITPSHVFTVNIDGSDRRQVTDSRDQGEVQVTFSPNGKELLIGTGLCSFIFFTGQYIQVVPADGNMLDVTDGPSPYKLKIDGQTACTNTKMSWR
jgi:Tol biopolymer transport system component